MTVDLSHFPEFKDDAHFASEMLKEQSVFTIPGMVSVTQTSRIPNFDKRDFCHPPLDIIRIRVFNQLRLCTNTITLHN